MKYCNILLIVILCIISNCNNSRNCNSGTIPLSLYLKKMALALPSSDLPSEFSYTIKEFSNLIRGKWLSENGDSYIELEIDTCKEAYFNVALSGTLCGPTCCKINFVGIYKNNSSEEPLSGIVTGYSKIDRGDVELIIGNNKYFVDFKKTPNDSCMIVGDFRDLSTSYFTKQ